MPSKKQQIQWIREDIALAEAFAEEDRRSGFDDAYRRGRATGLLRALHILGVDA